MNIELARQQMVQQQIRTWDVADQAVLDAVQQLNRDQFVPTEYAHLAYADMEIPLAYGQFMMKPIVEGRLLQALKIGAQDSVLEIGTGTGYLTACLAGLADHVCSIDIHTKFVQEAKHRLSDIGVSNVALECMDAMTNLPRGEFDAIAVTGSMPELDRRLVEALKPDGRIFLVVGDAPVMSAELVTRLAGGRWQSTSLFETEIQALINVQKTPMFSF